MALPPQDIAKGRIDSETLLSGFLYSLCYPSPNPNLNVTQQWQAFLLFVFDILSDPLAEGEFLGAFRPQVCLFVCTHGSKRASILVSGPPSLSFEGDVKSGAEKYSCFGNKKFVVS